MKKEKQSEFRYSKDSGHLPILGIGPLYVMVTGGMTALAVLLDRINVLPSARPVWGQLLFVTLGGMLVISGIVLWLRAFMGDKIDDRIAKNRLVISGAYACVRNPTYTAFLMLFTGTLLINGNVLTFVLPFVYWLFMTVMMKRTEEIWLLERYGAEYEAYCRKVNRCIPSVPEKDALYQSDISNVRWISYDLPGNIGWILYIACLILAFVKKAAFMESTLLLQIMIVAIIPAMLMLSGIIELIGERIHKLDRVLPRACLWRGFGTLMIGGATGTMIMVVMLICAAINGVGELLLLWLMLIGGILCGVFAGLLLKRYKRK